MILMVYASLAGINVLHALIQLLIVLPALNRDLILQIVHVKLDNMIPRLISEGAKVVPLFAKPVLIRTALA